MKWAAGPLLFLGACRIHIALEANHRESPCGRGAEGTTQGARPSEEGWDRSQCRYKAQALWSHPAPLRFRYGSLQFLYSFITARYALLRHCYGFVPTPTKIRLISVTMPRSPHTGGRVPHGGGDATAPRRQTRLRERGLAGGRIPAAVFPIRPCRAPRTCADYP